jgi:SAM-dependent methyltransferase
MGFNMKSPVARVSRSRWLQAQKFELATWKRQNSRYYGLMSSLMRVLGLKKTKVGDDWNSWWYQQFDAYRVLPEQLDQAIELGCGPYTNIRLIMQNHTLGRVICSDPLASHYINFKGQWLASEYAKGTILVDNHPIEECPYADSYFDLVVMINVLDHVQDAFTCLDTAVRITKPNGYLVIGQDLSDETDAAKEDICHPIRLSHEDMNDHITGFDSKLYKILDREQGRNPQAHYGTLLFIGKKHGS